MIDDKSKDFVHRHFLGVLGTVDQHGEPWGSAVFYANDSRGNIYFLTRDATSKFDNIQANPRVSFVIFDESNRQTLQLHGVARQIQEPGVIEEWAAKIRSSISQAEPDMPVDHMENGDYKLIMIEPKHTHYSDYKS